MSANFENTEGYLSRHSVDSQYCIVDDYKIHNSYRGVSIIDSSHRHIDLVRTWRNLFDDDYRQRTSVILRAKMKRKEKEDGRRNGTLSGQHQFHLARLVGESSQSGRPLFTPDAGDADDAVTLAKRTLSHIHACTHCCACVPIDGYARREKSTYRSLYAIESAVYLSYID